MEQEKRILLVDDDSSFTDLYSAVFNNFGFKYSVAQNGAVALETASQEKPSLLLLDVMLADMNGFEVLKKLKSNPETKDIPVWMITNLAEQVNRETASSLGASDYLVKSSYTPKQVCEKIKKFFGS
ncbi:MAG: response regulator [Candidatus Woykebacteria bacterium]